MFSLSLFLLTEAQSEALDNAGMTAAVDYIVSRFDTEAGRGLKHRAEAAMAAAHALMACSFAVGHSCSARKVLESMNNDAWEGWAAILREIAAEEAAEADRQHADWMSRHPLDA